MKIFLAHLIVMGLHVKINTKVLGSWRDCENCFFGTYMGRNTFQSFMSNLQVSDSTLDLPCIHPLHDPLFKVKPFLDMMDKNFK